MPSSAPAAAVPLIEGEHQDIHQDIKELLGEAEAARWLATPNYNFDGRCPSDLIGTSDEGLIRNCLRSVVYSGMS